MTQVGADFSPRWSVCWVTTYTFDPGFFATFLLPRLGERPRNVVVLADFVKLADAWAAIDPDDARDLRGANRTYLVHPVSLGGAFHPKTVLLANGKEGLLLVGSGNLGLHGMERGNEVFARFDSRDDAAPFAAWRVWISRIVDHAANPLLHGRWVRALETAAWLSGAPGPSRFVTNWERPLMDQLVGGVPSPADELWLTAPFFDRDLLALRELLQRARPRRVHLFVGDRTSVQGQQLSAVLRGADADVQIRRYEPHDFVHAKLLAVVADGRARLLSGSANLSAPALLHAVTDGGQVNAEAGTIVELQAERLEAVFIPPEHEAPIVAHEALSAYEFAADSTETVTPVQLVAAVRNDAGVVTVVSRPEGDGTSLTDGTTTLAVRGGRTDGGWPDGSTLVWLVGDGEPVSNRVPLADARALADALNENQAGNDRPVDLHALDDAHPLGQLLLNLHQHALLDVGEHPTVQRIERLERDDTEANAGFWERLKREQLAQDPRLDRYLRRSGTPGPRGDELSWLLDQMLDRVPAPNVLRLIGGSELDRETVEREGHRWTEDHSLAVRAYNILHRWSLAVGDPRTRWLTNTAPVRHFELLLDALAQIWVQDEPWLAEERLRKLLHTLLGAFVRTERTVGFLCRTPDDVRDEALAELRAGPGPWLAAGLTFIALRVAPSGEFFDWQPFLVPGLDAGVFAADDRSAELVARASNLRPSARAIDARLRLAASYTDDEHWSARRAADLGVERVVLRRVKNDRYPIELDVRGAGPVLTDPRFVTLVREALTYARNAGLRLRAGPDLVTVRLAEPMYGIVEGLDVESPVRVTLEALTELEIAGHGLDGLGIAQSRVA